MCVLCIWYFFCTVLFEIILAVWWCPWWWSWSFLGRALFFLVLVLFALSFSSIFRPFSVSTIASAPRTERMAKIIPKFSMACSTTSARGRRSSRSWRPEFAPAAPILRAPAFRTPILFWCSNLRRHCTFFRWQSCSENSEKRTRRGCDQRPHVGPQWTDVWTSERRGSDELFLIPPPQTPKDLVDTGDTHSIVNKNWSMEGSTEWRLKLPLVGDRWWMLVGRSLRLGWVGGGEVGKSYVLIDIPLGE